ncbi:MAG: DUF4422 domain-containing protein [Clostridia bacterium]|nr:DUF4422 domain-containing protein [Clostridia bacterium]
MDIKVIVAAHKIYNMPGEDIYLPLHVGAQNKEPMGFERDDSGDNISLKNPYFCELTGLYWAWKNLTCDYLGLAHYRRHFGEQNGKQILKSDTAKALLSSTDIVLPKKRKYYIENLYDHYIHTLCREPLDITGEIIQEKYPQYFAEFENLKKRTSAHMFNMYIMKKEISDAYCEWLFDILFELEKRCKDFVCDDFQVRFYGRVSELLLDVYINTNNLEYKECPLCFVEKENIFKKGIGFLKAKFFGKKYNKSM